MTPMNILEVMMVAMSDVQRFAEILRRDMEADGFNIIEPGDRTFSQFRLRYWHADSFLAQKGKDVWVPLINARKPGTGAFGRLVRQIECDGLNVVVLVPIGRMTEILKRWGWKPGLESVMGGVEEVWRRP